MIGFSVMIHGTERNIIMIKVYYNFVQLVIHSVVRESYILCIGMPFKKWSLAKSFSETYSDNPPQKSVLMIFLCITLPDNINKVIDLWWLELLHRLAALIQPISAILKIFVSL